MARGKGQQGALWAGRVVVGSAVLWEEVPACLSGAVPGHQAPRGLGWPRWLVVVGLWLVSRAQAGRWDLV